ncbi:phenylacetate--CoA ligase family protein [Lutibacter sp. B1]|uniref:phenylacetate--CoA ligase family protein n=1 Tax=Lutibacter sp. B1 TaxID=2725996 RepID=UPI0014574B6B|nr:phenylacetate--CoA ligase family protein [Lutibacter sp. B1]NLP58146.1 phenylacetate--CoA ligase family protein [Lutibacter sp. B1]
MERCFNMMEKLYRICPVFIQNILISLYGFYWKNRRYGGVFKEKLNEYKLRESFSKNDWEIYQEKELKKLLIHAFKTVPFYKELYNKKGFKLHDFENFSLEKLKKIPFLEKDDLRKYGTTLLLSENRKKGKFYASSGTTGTPIKIYFSTKFHQSWSALYEVRVRNWAGVNHKMSRAMIGGRRVLVTSKIKPPFHRYNFVEKQAYFSAYHISNESSKIYIDEIIKVKPNYLVGYAKSIYLLAKVINEQKLKVPNMLAVLTSSEKLTKKMRVEIGTAFNCKVFDAYSGVEACGLISENKYNELMFSPDSGILEVIDNEGVPVKNGEIGEVVFTGFLNYDQPLIRYKIGDRVKLAENQTSKSGLEMPIIEEIEGRIEDVIIGKEGQKMVRFHAIFVDIQSIIMAQVIQNSIEEIHIKLIVDNFYDASSEKIMIDRIKNQLGDVNIIFEYVSTIENSENGKYKAVISHLKNE